MSLYLAAILAYALALAAAALWRARRAQTADEFLVAGRTLPAHVLVFTLLSTWIGSGSLFAGAGLGYRVGLPALWQSAGAWLGIAFVFFIAPRVRRLARYTVPEILELRYGPAARVLGMITTTVAYATIAAYQFRGGGRLLELVAGIDPATGALVTALFCVAFTASAGMASVARLDVANGAMMLGGITLAVVYLAGQASGASGAAPLRADQLTIFGALSPAEALGLFLPTLCLLLGEASMYQKFASARDERAARVAVAGWIAGTMAIETMIVAIGMLGGTLIPGLQAGESEAILIRVSLEVLPTALGVLLLAGAAAIIVSTANSMLLIAATNLVRDGYGRFVRPQPSEPEVILCTRLAVAALAAVGVAAGSLFPTILAMALWAYTMYGAGIAPALLAAFLWPRATPRAGVWSIAAGMSVTLAWELSAVLRGTTAAPDYLLGLQTIYAALAASIATLVAVTLAGRAGPAAATPPRRMPSAPTDGPA